MGNKTNYVQAINIANLFYRTRKIKLQKKSKIQKWGRDYL